MKSYKSLAKIGALPVFAVFFLESFVLGNWITRIPDVKRSFGFSASELGLTILMLSLGTLFSFLIAGSIVRKLGLSGANMLALPFWGLCVAIAPWTANGIMLGCVFLFAGFFIGIQEVAMNTASEEVSKSSGIQIMSRAHGFWSLGSLFGALVGAGFGQFEINTQVHFAIVLIPTAILSYFVASRIQEPSYDIAMDTHSDTPVFMLPKKSIVLLCCMPLGIMLVEGAFIDWSALFIQTVLDGGALATGLIYAAFSAVMAATRLNGDRIIERYGAVKVARVSCLSAFIGILLFASATNLYVAFFAAALSGLGVAIVYPMAITASARRPGNDADNVAAVSLFGFGSFMVAPPAIGFIADFVGLDIALLMIAPLTLTSLWLSGELGKKR